MEKELGAETKLKAELVGGKIKLGVVYDGKQVDAAVSISSDVDSICDALAALWPGEGVAEGLVIGLLRSSLKSLVI